MISLILFTIASLAFCKVERYYSYNYADSNGHSINYRNENGEKQFSTAGYNDKDSNSIKENLETFENHSIFGDFRLPSIFSNDFFNFPALPSSSQVANKDKTSLEIANLERKLTKCDSNIEQYNENKKNINQAIEKANKRLEEINEDFLEISKLVKKNSVSARLNGKLYDYAQQLKRERKNLNNNIESYKNLIKNNSDAITELEELKLKVNEKISELKTISEASVLPKEKVLAKNTEETDPKLKTVFLTDEEIDNLFEQ